MSRKKSARARVSGKMNPRPPEPPAPDSPQWQRPVWICLCGEQPMPNVIPVLACRPERVVLLRTDLTGSRDAAGRIENFLRGRDIIAGSVQVDAFDDSSVHNAISRIVNQYGAQSTLINWTGGTKPMSLAAYRAAGGAVTRLYYDQRAGIRLNDEPFQPLPNPIDLGIRDHIQLNAGVHIEPQADRPPPAPRSTRVLINALTRRPESGDAILKWLADYRFNVLEPLRRNRRWLADPGPIPTPPQCPDHPRLHTGLTDAMLEDDLLDEPADSDERFVPTTEGLGFLHGFWWEGVVHHLLLDGLRNLGETAPANTIERNLNLKWPGHKTNNELDLAFLRANRLYFISCTTAVESLAEEKRRAVENMALNLGGRFARGMLACTLDEGRAGAIQARGRLTTLVPHWSRWLQPDQLLKDWFAL